MNKHTFAIPLMVLSLIVLGCSEKSEKLLPVPDYSGLKKEDKQSVGEFVPFNPAVDILFVIDSSGSMLEHQTNLSTNIDKFITEISKNSVLDWRIGVTDSDSSPNGYGALLGSPRYVDKATPGFQSALRRNLMVGTSGSGYEEFFSPITGAFSSGMIGGLNTGFFRKDALLVLFVITDTEDQSNLSAQQTATQLISFKGAQDKVAIYAVLADPAVMGCEGEYQDPTKIRELVNQLNGKEFLLCDPKFGENLANIGTDILKKVDMVIRLRQRPVVSTLEVRFGTQTIPNDPVTGWIYDPIQNAIILSREMKLKPEPKGTQIEVKFTAAILPN